MVLSETMAEGLRKAKKRNITEAEAETLLGEMGARKVVLIVMVPEDHLPLNPAICMVRQQCQQCHGAALRTGLTAVFIVLR